MLETTASATPKNVTDTLQKIHGLHIFLTFVLFALNMALTQLISTDRFIGRLKYVGHEMAFLACGIVLSRLFTANTSDDRVLILSALIFYVFMWIATLLLTRQVLANAPIMLTPLIGATLLLGIATVTCSLSGIVESSLIRFFME